MIYIYMVYIGFVGYIGYIRYIRYIGYIYIYIYICRPITTPMLLRTSTWCREFGEAAPRHAHSKMRCPRHVQNKTNPAQTTLAEW